MIKTLRTFGMVIKQGRFQLLSLVLAFSFLLAELTQAQTPFDFSDPLTHWGLTIDKNQYERAVAEYVDKLPNVATETQRVMALFSKATNYAFQEAQQYGEFKGGVFHDPELGRAEFVDVAGTLLIRINESMGSEILFVHSQYVEKDSKELLRYINQTNSMAEKQGRNLIVVWHDDQNIESAQLHKKASKWSLNYWKGYLFHVHKPATLDSFCFGVMGGLAQATLTAILGVLQNGFTPHVAIMSASVFGFGTFIGTYAATYRNIVFYSHSKLGQVLKQSVVSYAFAYMVYSINQMAFGAAHHAMTFAEQMGLIFNVLLTSSAKNEFSQWARIKDLGKADLKEYMVKLPLLDRSFKFSEKDVNYQMKVQLTTQAIRMVDLLGYHLNIPTATGFYKIEFGKILLWLSAPIVNLTVKKWAMKNYPETARQMGLDKTLQQSVKELFSGLGNMFKINPEALNALPLESAIKAEISEVDKSYLDAFVKNLNNPSGRTQARIFRCQDLFLALHQ